MPRSRERVRLEDGLKLDLDRLMRDCFAKRGEFRRGQVDNTLCELDFGAKKVSFEARKAHELYATLIKNGVPSDGSRLRPAPRKFPSLPMNSPNGEAS
jgi:hypothetical protein